MCGICGMYGFSDKELLKKMCAVIAHRGPDGEGIHLDDNVGLGNRRLSIIDLETGGQPIQNEDGSMWVVYNGEIYNYRQLRLDLEQLGHRFYTASDTEVLVHLYEEHGPLFSKLLRGIYAFAIWDGKTKTLILARDEVGVKPLYYAQTRDGLLFGSEIKALLTYQELPRRLDYSALESYLTFGSVLGTDTLFQDVKKLSPGHTLIARENKIEIRKHWGLSSGTLTGTEREFAHKIRELLAESVELQLMSDVPLGAFLSGGVDSSSVVGLMSSFTKVPVKTFTVGFGEADDELQYARLVSEHFGTEHLELVIQPRDIIDSIPKLVWYCDDLISDTATVPTYLISRLAARHVKVVVTGEGGDELFAGYPRDRVMSPSLWFMPAALRWRVFKRTISLFREEHKNSLYPPSTPRCNDTYAIVNPYFAGASDLLHKTMLFEFQQLLPNQLLSKVDRMGMANSLEARVPILDKELVDYCMRLPSSMRMKGFHSKLVFRKAVEKIVPKVILERKKKGFGAPLEKWFTTEVGEYIENVLFEPETQRREYLNFGYAKDLFSGATSRKGNYYRLWNLLLLELWYRRFFG